MGRTNANTPPAAFVRPLFLFDAELTAFQARHDRVEALVASIQPKLIAVELALALLTLVIVASPIVHSLREVFP